MWMLFLNDMKKSRDFKDGIDFACGNMANYKNFRTDNYLGVDIDEERLEEGFKKHPHARYLKSSIEETPPNIQGDFVVCVQTIRINNHFNNENTLFCIQKLINSTKKNGILLFNIKVGKGMEIEAETDKLLNKSFEKVKKVEYGRFDSQYRKSISLLISLLMYLVSSIRKDKNNRLVYYFSEKRL